MNPIAESVPTAEWIEAIATVFAAVGTIGAVWVALWQVGQQHKRRLEVTCRWAFIGGAHGQMLALSATNSGFRPVKIVMAHLMTTDGNQVFARFDPHSSPVPSVVQDGDSLGVFWAQSDLDQIKAKEQFERYAYAFFVDAQGSVYDAPYPGMRRRFGRRAKYVPVRKGGRLGRLWPFRRAQVPATD
jgi:hypothetical protein